MMLQWTLLHVYTGRYNYIIIKLFLLLLNLFSFSNDFNPSRSITSFVSIHIVSNKMPFSNVIWIRYGVETKNNTTVSFLNVESNIPEVTGVCVCVCIRQTKMCATDNIRFPIVIIYWRNHDSGGTVANCDSIMSHEKKHGNKRHRTNRNVNKYKYTTLIIPFDWMHTVQVGSRGMMAGKSIHNLSIDNRNKCKQCSKYFQIRHNIFIVSHTHTCNRSYCYCLYREPMHNRIASHT